MKKIIILVITSLLFITGCSIFQNEKIKKVEEKIKEYSSLMNLDNFKDIVLDKIESIDYTRLTVAGSDTQKIVDKDEIKKIYNSLKDKKVGKEVSTACEDNTTIYTFHMNDGKNTRVEIECDWLVIGNKRYELK